MKSTNQRGFMILWEYRIKQYKICLKENAIQNRSKKNYEIEEIISDYGKDGYELVNVISEPLFDENNLQISYCIRTFFFKRTRL